MTVYYDDSLPCLATVIGRELGRQALIDGVALRDISGRLAFYMPEELPEAETNRISLLLREALGPYARSDVVFAGGEDFGVRELATDPNALIVWTGQTNIRLLDRRLVGADWLRKPSPPAPPPPRLIFASLKGGVGRSTALAVVAADLAAHGLRVLAIDLDMEAPGLGSILLDEETLPEFGVLDALVENSFDHIDDLFLADLVGPSPLAARSGVINVAPAFGKRSLRYPADVLSKLSRAYTEDISSTGAVATILDQIRALVDILADPTRYDVILIDARAGLHETTAASILGLGGEVFLFGLDEPQTYQGYRALLSHLGRLVSLDEPEPEWVQRITMVQGRATDSLVSPAFAQSCAQLFEETGLKRPSAHRDSLTMASGGSGFNEFEWDEETPDSIVLSEIDDQDWSVLSIKEDNKFKHFDPCRQSQLMDPREYRNAFGNLLDRVHEIVANFAEGGD